MSDNYSTPPNTGHCKQLSHHITTNSATHFMWRITHSHIICADIRFPVISTLCATAFAELFNHRTEKRTTVQIHSEFKWMGRALKTWAPGSGEVQQFFHLPHLLLPRIFSNIQHIQYNIQYVQYNIYCIQYTQGPATTNSWWDFSTSAPCKPWFPGNTHHQHC